MGRVDVDVGLTLPLSPKTHNECQAERSQHLVAHVIGAWLGDRLFFFAVRAGSRESSHLFSAVDDDGNCVLDGSTHKERQVE